MSALRIRPPSRPSAAPGVGAAVHAALVTGCAQGISGDQRNVSEGEDSEECLLCCEPISYIAYGTCDHAQCCAECMFRLRALVRASLRTVASRPFV